MRWGARHTAVIDKPDGKISLENDDLTVLQRNVKMMDDAGLTDPDAWVWTDHGEA